MQKGPRADCWLGCAEALLGGAVRLEEREAEDAAALAGRPVLLRMPAGAVVLRMVALGAAPPEARAMRAAVSVGALNADEETGMRRCPSNT